MNERIKKLRRSLDLTQQDFTDRLGTTRNNIAGYETGRRALSVAVISLICREFNVSETWLRTGEGEMFAPEPEFNLDEYVKRRGMTALERDILKAYLDLDLNLRETLLQHFKDRLAACLMIWISLWRISFTAHSENKPRPRCLRHQGRMRKELEVSL